MLSAHGLSVASGMRQWLADFRNRQGFLLNNLLVFALLPFAARARAEPIRCPSIGQRRFP